MKKILPICIMGLLIISCFGTIVIPTIAESKNFDNTFATHTVFGEYGTATWCNPCKYAHGALKELYKEGQLDFYYVSLVSDQNTIAYNRADVDYNVYGWPTLWWDGGYEVDVGASSIPGAKTTYTNSINSCGSRTVKNVNIDLDATWLGGTNMQIECTVNNNEGATYGGTIRVYITEIASSEGWTDTGGNLYTFAFLDWAFNEAISISSGGSWSESMTWDGSSYGYSGVTADNTMIIAAVFNDEWHQGYSYTPPSNPFDAYYVDDTVGIRIGNNRPPNTPSNPDPNNGATGVSLTPTLSWDGGDPDWFDDVTYDVYFEKDDSNPDVLVSNDQTETTYNPGTLDMDSTYYWKIVSEDNHGSSTSGPVWQFTTLGNNPPYTPSDPDPEDGEIDVSINANLEWSGGDPDGNTVTYDVYFEKDDSTPDVLVSDDQLETMYDPGTLDMEGNYFWQIVAEDEYGLTATGPIWEFTTRGNDPPYTPSDPDPENGEVDVDVNTNLEWSGDDPDGDSVTYDVYFEKDNPDPVILVSEDQSSSSYSPGTLELESTYYWKIVSEDYYGEITIGPVWSFTTAGTPNNQPNIPIITGEVNGKAGTEYEYIFKANDPDDDNVYFWILWGDSCPAIEWIGPYESCEEVTLSHTFTNQGTYTISAKARDIHEAESDWGELDITMPKNKVFQRPFLNFLTSHLNIFPILQRLIQQFLL